MRRREFEELEPRALLSATMVEHNGVAYFPAADQSQLERYDIAAESWLAPVDLPGVFRISTAVLVDDDGVYMAYGSTLYRYAPNGTGATLLSGAWSTISALHSDGNLLLVNHSDTSNIRFTSIDKSTNAILDTFQSTLDNLAGSSIAPQLNRILGRTSGPGLSDLAYVSYADDGQFIEADDGPYYDEFHSATETWMFPDGSKVVDNSGNVYSTADLSHVASFGMRVEGIDFYGDDQYVVLLNNTVTAYSSSFLPTGSFTLSSSPDEIYVNGENVIAFTRDTFQPNDYRVQIAPLSVFTLPQPGPAVNPVGLAYAPSQIAQAADGTVLLLAQTSRSIFRWDPATESYVESIPLIERPRYMAYSAVTNTIYVSYNSRLIWKIDLNQESHVEVPFAFLPDVPHGLQTAGPYLFAVDPWGTGYSHYTFDPSGALVSTLDSNHLSGAFTWSDVNQRMYFLRDDTSPNDVYWEQINADGSYPTLPAGGIGDQHQSPLHTDAGWSHPVRVSPDGNVVLLGSGYLHDANSLDRLPFGLASSIQDAVWRNGQLYTIRDTAAGAQIQQWSQPNYEPGLSKYVVGSTVALLTTSDNRLLAITRAASGVPRFTLLNDQLKPVGTSKVQITETADATEVSESGSSDTIEVVLAMAPASNVVLDIVNADYGELSIAEATLVFTPENWSIPQTVTFTGVNDAIVDGNQKTLVTFRVNAAASDPAFSSALDQFAIVTTLDDQTKLAVLVEAGGIAYFFAASQPHVERFEIGGGIWLSPLSLAAPDEPLTAAHVDADGLYVAHGRSVYRYDLDGTNRRHIINMLQDVRSLHTDGNVLFVNQIATVLSFDKTTLAWIDEIESYSQMGGASIAVSTNRLFGRTTNSSPADVNYVSYSDDGHFIRSGDGPHHGEYPGASRTWMFPNERKLVDNSGHVYATTNLRHLGNFPSVIDDVSFFGSDVPVVLRSGVVTAFDQALRATGSINVTHPAGAITEIIVGGSALFAFHADPTQPSGMSVTEYQLNSLNLAESGAPIDPRNLAITPDKVQVKADGNLLLFSMAFQSVFTWNPTSQEFGPTITLQGTPDRVTYSSAHNAIYLAYGARIFKLDLLDPQQGEQLFVTLPASAYALTAVGDYLLAIETPTGIHKTFDQFGNLVDERLQTGSASDPVWSEANGTLYLIWESLSPADLAAETIGAAGQLGVQVDSPLHSGQGFTRPLRIAPDGSIAVLGSGYIHNAQTLERSQFALANSILDATWIGPRLFTIRDIATGVEVQQWDPVTYSLVQAEYLPGKTVSLLTLSDGRLLAITKNGQGIPQFTLFDEDLVDLGQPHGIHVGDTDGGTLVSEAGSTDTVQVVLTTAPAANVVIDVTSLDSTEVQASAAQLIFTPQNWGVPQLVTLTGVDDAVVDDDQLSMISFKVNVAGSDSAFHGATEKYASVTTLDNDTKLAALIETGGVAYFFAANHPRVERFEIATGTWLPSIHLAGPSEPLTAAHVDADGLYIAHGRSVYRYDPDGSNRRHVINAVNDVVALHTDGGLLFVNFSERLWGRVLSFDKSTLALLDEIEVYTDALMGSAISTLENRIVGRSLGVSPSAITYVQYNDAGQFQGGGNGIISNVSPAATRTWAYPNGAKFLDDFGQVYAASNQLTLGSFPTKVDDVTFLGSDVPLVLRSGIVTAYSNTYVATGSINVTSAGTVTEILANTSTLFAFSLDPTQPGGMRLTTFAAAALHAPQSGLPVNPQGVVYTPGEMTLAADGNLLIYSATLQSLFRWNPLTQRYIESIPLLGTADHVAYVAATNTIYLAYKSGWIRKLDLNQPVRTEVPFLYLERPAQGLAAAGAYLFISAYQSHYTVDAGGNVLSDVGNTSNSTDFVWSDVNQRMYFLQDERSPNSLTWRQINASGDAYPELIPGGFGQQLSAVFPATGFAHPVRVSPDGSLVVLGSGSMHDATTLERLSAKLPNTVFDAAWLGNTLFTLFAVNSTTTRLQQWSGTTVVDQLQLSSRPVSLLALPGERLLVTTLSSSSGVPQFLVVDAALDSVTPAAEIVGRQLFYDASRYDLGPGLDGQDDAAIATDKSPFIPIPGSAARSYAHVSSYSRGINGLMIDLRGPHGELTLDDFTFKMGNTTNSGSWSLAPLPTGFTVRAGAGAEGSDRIQFTWPAGSIVNTWLQVEVRSTARTNLQSQQEVGDVFYFGSLVGETGNAPALYYTVTAGDFLKTRNTVGINLPVTTVGDHNRDGKISAGDLVLTRMPPGFLGLVTLPAPAAATPATPPPASGTLATATDQGKAFSPTPESPQILPAEIAIQFGFRYYGFGRDSRFDQYLFGSSTAPSQIAATVGTTAAEPGEVVDELALELPQAHDPAASLDLDFVETQLLQADSAPLLDDEDADLRELLV